jgi:hypothetical protein
MARTMTCGRREQIAQVSVLPRQCLASSVVSPIGHVRCRCLHQAGQREQNMKRIMQHRANLGSDSPYYSQPDGNTDNAEDDGGSQVGRGMHDE